MLRSLTLGVAALAACLAAAAAGTLPPGALGEANQAAQARMDAFQARQQATAERVIRSICIGCLPAADPVRTASARPGSAVRTAAAPSARRAAASPARRPEAEPARPRRLAMVRGLKRTLLARLMLPDDGE